MANFGRKKVFLNICPLLKVWKKKLFKQIQIFLRICPFSNMLRKTNFLRFSVLLSKIVTFWTKKRSSLWISPIKLQNNRKASFSYMWLTFWRKTFFLNICPLLKVWKKKLLKKIQIFLRICPFSNMLRKTNFWVFQCSFLR